MSAHSPGPSPFPQAGRGLRRRSSGLRIHKKKSAYCIASQTFTGVSGIRRRLASSAWPARHIFVGSKAPWFTITDDLPQHEEFPT